MVGILWAAAAAAGEVKVAEGADGVTLDNGKVAVAVLVGSAGPVIRSARADAPASISVGVITRGNAGKVGKVEVVKKERGEATLRVTLDAAQADVTLKAGQPFIAVAPVKEADAVEVVVKSSYAVLPDFFGYDTVYNPRKFKSPSLLVPAENFLLGMEEGGNAMVMCVWQGTLALGEKDEAARAATKDAKDPRVDLFLAGEGAARKVERMRIEMPGKPVYVALLAGPGLWHDEDVSGWEAQKPTELAWKRPFVAKWRANFLGKEGAWSNDMFSRNLSVPVLFRDSPARWNGDIPTMSIQGLWPYFICPFWLNGDRTFMALYSDMNDRKAAEKANKDEKAAAKKENREAKTVYPKNIYERAFVYPMDRHQDTPISELTVVDVVRETLGQGPCEYVLDLEGIKGRPSGGTRDTLGATCGIVDQHLSQFLSALSGKDTYYKVGEKKLTAVKPGEKLAPEFEARLVQIMEDLGLFVTAVNGRVAEYNTFAEKMVAFCQAEGQRAAAVKPVADRILAKAKQLHGQTSQKLPGMTKQRDEWNATLAKLIEEIKAGNYANIKNAGRITHYAEGQDVFIAFCRRFVKAMREEASAVDSTDPEVVRFAARVRAISHDVLRNKHGMEGW
jgi:hypothetical protein